MNRWIVVVLVLVMMILSQMLLSTITERNAQVRELYLHQAVEWAKVTNQNRLLAIPVPSPRLAFFQSLNFRLDLRDPKHPEKRGIHQEGKLIGDEIHFPLDQPELVRDCPVGTLTVNGKDFMQMTFHIRLAPKDAPNEIGCWLNRVTFSQ